MLLAPPSICCPPPPTRSPRHPKPPGCFWDVVPVTFTTRLSGVGAWRFVRSPEGRRCALVCFFSFLFLLACACAYVHKRRTHSGRISANDAMKKSAEFMNRFRLFLVCCSLTVKLVSVRQFGSAVENCSCLFHGL